MLENKDTVVAYSAVVDGYLVLVQEATGATDGASAVH